MKGTKKKKLISTAPLQKALSFIKHWPDAARNNKLVKVKYKMFFAEHKSSAALDSFPLHRDKEDGEQC